MAFQNTAQPAALPLIDNVPDVLAAADALGWERFSLLGHSLGAAVASFTAAAAKSRIEQMLLIEGLGPLSGDARDEPERLRRYLRQHASQEKSVAVSILPWMPQPHNVPATAIFPKMPHCTWQGAVRLRSGTAMFIGDMIRA